MMALGHDNTLHDFRVDLGFARFEASDAVAVLESAVAALETLQLEHCGYERYTPELAEMVDEFEALRRAAKGFADRLQTLHRETPSCR